MSLARTMHRLGHPTRYAVDPRQAEALRRYLQLNQRVGGLSPGGPDLARLLSTMTPLEQALLLELMTSGAL